MDTLEYVRPNTIFISWQSKKALDYIAKATGQNRDEIAEQVLADWIQANHPNVVAFLRQRYEQDKQFIKDLKATLPAPPLKDDTDLP